MKSPFITLTPTRGKRVIVNILHIVHMEDQTYPNSDARCTYISLTSPCSTIHVKENLDKVQKLITFYYAQEHTHGMEK